MRKTMICLTVLWTVFGGVSAGAETIEFPRAPGAAAFPEWGAPAGPAEANPPPRSAAPVPSVDRSAPPTPAHPSHARRTPRASTAAAPEAPPVEAGVPEVVLPDPPAPPLAWTGDEAPPAAAGPLDVPRPSLGAEWDQASAATTNALEAPPAAPVPPARSAVPRASARPASPTRGAARPSGVPWGWIAAGSLTGGAFLLLARVPGRRRRPRWRVGDEAPSYSAESIGDLARAPAPPVRVRLRPPDIDERRAGVPFHDAIERRLRHRSSEAMGDIVHVARVRAERRADEIREMAETGEPAVRIARRIGVPLGEVEAVLGVERRRGEARAV